MCPCQPECEEWNVLIGHSRSCPFLVVDSTIRMGRRTSGKEKNEKTKNKKPTNSAGQRATDSGSGLCSMSNRELVQIVEQRSALVRARVQGL